MTPDTPAGSSRRPRIGRRARSAVVLAVGIALGVAVASGLPGMLRAQLGPADAGDGGALEVTGRIKDAPATSSAAADQPVSADEPAAAVTRFLEAESAGRFADAFAFLSSTDREELGGPAGYVAGHADLMPPVATFTVVSSEEAEPAARVVTEVAFRPSLDEVSGLTPGRADVTWTVVPEGSGWAIDLAATEVVPRYPEEGTAAADVLEWTRTRQACGDSEHEHIALRGVPALADALCDADGDAVIGETTRLADTDAASYLAAYGGEVVEWARVVDVTAPVPLRAVVAPIGEDWTVIGVLENQDGR